MKSLKTLMDLNGRVALITGGAGHLGAAMCESLAELGASLVIVDIMESSCNQLSQALKETYQIDVLPLVMDLSDEQALLDLPKKVLSQFGKLDILVNNAALVGSNDLKGWAVPFDQQSADTWRLALEVNLTVPFILVQAFADALRTSKHGSVINIGSIYGVVGPDPALYEGTNMGNPSAYAASKGGLIQFTRWLATSLAPDIRVNAISPGGVWRNQPDSFTQKYIEKTPLKRMTTEEDIKGAVAYLASDLSAYVTGQHLLLDGGWTSW